MRSPGATNLDKESKRITRPAPESMENRDLSKTTSHTRINKNKDKDKDKDCTSGADLLGQLRKAWELSLPVVQEEIGI